MGSFPAHCGSKKLAKATTSTCYLASSSSKWPHKIQSQFSGKETSAMTELFVLFSKQLKLTTYNWNWGSFIPIFRKFIGSTSGQTWGVDIFGSYFWLGFFEKKENDITPFFDEGKMSFEVAGYNYL